MQEAAMNSTKEQKDYGQMRTLKINKEFVNNIDKMDNIEAVSRD
jgi:hypothetical protein